MEKIKQYGERKNNFGFIRLLSAIMVITGHMYVLTGQSAPGIMWGGLHGFGVASFFVIGGYLNTKSWIRQPIFKRYIVKRVFRIFPALFFWIFLTVFVIGPLMTSLSVKEYICNSLTWKYMLNCFLYINHYLPGVFENNIASEAVNGSLWCLPVEFLMYLVLPVYVNTGQKLSTKLQKWFYGGTTLFVIMGRVVWGAWFNEGNDIFKDATYLMNAVSSILWIIPYFFIGSFTASCKMEEYLNTQIGIVAIFIASIVTYLPAPFSYIGQYIFISYVVLSLALPEKPVFAMANKRDISYGIFLSGFVIQQMLIHIFVQKEYMINLWLLNTLSIGFSLLAGFLIEKFVERPAGRLGDKILFANAKEIDTDQKKG